VLLVIASPTAKTLSDTVVADNEVGMRRGIDVDAARYAGLAGYYGAKKDGVQRGIDASAARYTGWAGYYGARNDGIQRGIDAGAARYSALAEYYATAALVEKGTDSVGP